MGVAIHTFNNSLGYTNLGNVGGKSENQLLWRILKNYMIIMMM